MDLALTGDHGECMASRKRVISSGQNSGSTIRQCGALRRRKLSSAGLRLYLGLASVLIKILIRIIWTDDSEGPDIRAFRKSRKSVERPQGLARDLDAAKAGVDVEQCMEQQADLRSAAERYKGKWHVAVDTLTCTSETQLR